MNNEVFNSEVFVKKLPLNCLNCQFNCPTHQSWYLCGCNQEIRWHLFSEGIPDEQRDKRCPLKLINESEIKK